MDYAQMAQGQAGESCKRHVPLDDVERFADAVEEQARRVEYFCDRFFTGPAATGCDPTNAPSGYIGQLQRLGTAIDSLSKAVERLSEIG